MYILHLATALTLINMRGVARNLQQQQTHANRNVFHINILQSGNNEDAVSDTSLFAKDAEHFSI